MAFFNPSASSEHKAREVVMTKTSIISETWLSAGVVVFL